LKIHFNSIINTTVVGEDVNLLILLSTLIPLAHYISSYEQIFFIKLNKGKIETQIYSSDSIDDYTQRASFICTCYH